MQLVDASGKTSGLRTTVTLVLCLMFLLSLQPQAALAVQPVAFVEVVGPSTVATGQEFEVSVVVKNVTGLFGGQFELNFDPAYLQGVADSLQPGTSLEPSVVGVKNVNNSAGSILFAVSRRGAVEGLSGDVTLATMRFVATAPVSTTTINIGNVLLGDKQALAIASGGSQGLSLTITQAGATVRGQVTLEGRSAGNFDGGQVTIDGTQLSGTTNGEGNFEITGVTPGTYTFRADAVGYLPAVCTGAPVVAPLTELAPVKLLAGDVDGNGVIDITDAVAIGTAFGNAASNPAADLNDDGAVNVLDLILLAVNFGAETSTWNCVIDP